MRPSRSDGPVGRSSGARRHVRLARAAFNALIIGTSAALLGVSTRPAAAQTGTGADALWWNPALIVGAGRQVGMSIGKLLAISTDAGASVIIPFRRAFTIGVGVRYIDEGEEDATFLDPNAPTGTFDISTVVLAASFAAPFGDRFAAGFTAKVLRVGFACTGACNTNT